MWMKLSTFKTLLKYKKAKNEHSIHAFLLADRTIAFVVGKNVLWKHSMVISGLVLYLGQSLKSRYVHTHY